MAPAQAGPGTAIMAVDPTALAFVMGECNCDETRAIELLRRNGSDAQKAVRYQQRQMQFLARHGHSRSQSRSPAPGPTSPSSPVNGRHNAGGPGFTNGSSWQTPLSGPGTPVTGTHSPSTPEATFLSPHMLAPAAARKPLPSTRNNPKSPEQPVTPPAPIMSLPVRPPPGPPPGPSSNPSPYIQPITYPRYPATAEPAQPADSWSGAPQDTSYAGAPVPNISLVSGDTTYPASEWYQPEAAMPREAPPPPSWVDPEAQGSEEVTDAHTYIEAQVPETPPAPPEWDFTLPQLPVPDIFSPVPENMDERRDFNTWELAAAVRYGADLQWIQNYLRSFAAATIKARIDDEVEGFPSIFYAVESNNPAMLRLWASYGADVSAVHPATGTPLLAYAIILTYILDGQDTSPMVATLLSLGVSPKTIPESYYSPYTRDLPEDGPPLEEEGADVDEKWAWCTPAARKRLAQTANLTQRYYLERATRLKRAGVRHRQIASRRNAEAILGIPYFLIGQTIAANRLLRKLLSYITLPSRRPLVLAFAGPSGHGKTELARKLGYLLGLDLQVVDCTIVNQEKELFGPRAPYVGSERGSPLNNFIARNAGQRSIVFLDEFEKTSRDIHQSLLLPFDNGEYQDRRSLNTIDCSKTIWILATNALDDTILKFCAVNPDIFSDDQSTAQQLAKKLSKELRVAFLDRFGAPVTGRVSDFVPFLPFSQGEQAVVVQKFLLELSEKVRAPVNLSHGPEEQLLGNVRLRVRRDAHVCAHLAASEYSQELGARSLRTAVEHVEDRLVERYLDEDKEIDEEAGLREFVVDLNGGEIVVSMSAGGQQRG